MNKTEWPALNYTGYTKTLSTYLDGVGNLRMLENCRKHSWCCGILACLFSPLAFSAMHSAGFYGTSCGLNHPNSNTITSSLRSALFDNPYIKKWCLSKDMLCPWHFAAWHPFKNHFGALPPAKPSKEMHTLTTLPALCGSQAARTCAWPRKHESWVSTPLPQLFCGKTWLRRIGWTDFLMNRFQTSYGVLKRVNFINILSWTLGSAKARDACTLGCASAGISTDYIIL